MNENEKLDQGVATAPTSVECEPNLASELLAALKIARLFIITAHDHQSPYVNRILARVEAAIAKAEA